MDYLGGGGGGGKGYVGPPLKLLGGGGAGPPAPPSSYAYVISVDLAQYEIFRAKVCAQDIDVASMKLIQSF